MDIAVESRGRSRFQARIAAGLHRLTCERCRGLDDAVLFWVEVPVVSQDSGASRHGQITTTTSQAKPLGPKPDAFCQLSTKFAEFVS